MRLSSVLTTVNFLMTNKWRCEKFFSKKEFTMLATAADNRSSGSVSPYAIVLDSETTGLDSTMHRVVEIAFRVLKLSDGSFLCSFSSVIKLSEKDWKMAQPKALEVNGFTWERVCGEGRSLEEISRAIIALFKQHNIHKGNSFFLCQNPSFDRPFFSQIIPVEEQSKHSLPYHWLDLASMEVALRFTADVKDHRDHKVVSLSKDSIGSRYQIEAEKMPHRAMNGVDHVIEIYKKMIGFPLLTSLSKT